MAYTSNDTIRKQVELGFQAKGFDYAFTLKNQIDALKRSLAGLAQDFDAGRVSENTFNQEVRKQNSDLEVLNRRMEEAQRVLDGYADRVRRVAAAMDATGDATFKVAADTDRLRTKLNNLEMAEFSGKAITAAQAQQMLADALARSADTTERLQRAMASARRLDAAVAAAGGVGAADPALLKQQADAWRTVGFIQRGVAQDAQQLADAQKLAGVATASHAATAAKGTATLQQSQKQTAAAARALLEFSRGLEDFSTGGFIGVLNNIPGMVYHIGEALGATPAMVTAVTAAVSVLGTALFVVYNNWNKITAGMKEGVPVDRFLTRAELIGVEYSRLKEKHDDYIKKVKDGQKLDQSEAIDFKNTRLLMERYEKLKEIEDHRKEKEKKEQKREREELDQKEEDIRKLTEKKTERDEAWGKSVEAAVAKVGGSTAVAQVAAALNNVGVKGEAALQQAGELIYDAQKNGEKARERLVRTLVAGGKGDNTFGRALQERAINEENKRVDEEAEKARKHGEEEAKKGVKRFADKLTDAVKARMKARDERIKFEDEQADAESRREADDRKEQQERLKRILKDSLKDRYMNGENIDDVVASMLEQMLPKKYGPFLLEMTHEITKDVKASVDEMIQTWRDVEGLTENEIGARKAAHQRAKYEKILEGQADENFTNLAWQVHEARKQFDPTIGNLTQSQAEDWGKMIRAQFAEQGFSPDMQAALARRLNSRGGMNNVGLLGDFMQMAPNADVAGQMFLDRTFNADAPLNAFVENNRAMNIFMRQQASVLNGWATMSNEQRRLLDRIATLEQFFAQMSNQPAFQPRFGW